MERGGSVARFSGDLSGKLDRRLTTALCKGGAWVRYLLTSQALLATFLIPEVFGLDGRILAAKLPS